MSSFQHRIARAMVLDKHIYDEVEHDRKALPQALIVVVLSSLAAGIGSVGVAGISGLFALTIGALVSWAIWSTMTWFVGTRLLPQPQTQSNIGELLRTTGFAASPGLIRILGIVPGLAWISQVVASLWMLAAFVVAVRQALDYNNTPRAIGVCAIGWVLMLLINMALWFLTLGTFRL